MPHVRVFPVHEDGHLFKKTYTQWAELPWWRGRAELNPNQIKMVLWKKNNITPTFFGLIRIIPTRVFPGKMVVSGLSLLQFRNQADLISPELTQFAMPNLREKTWKKCPVTFHEVLPSRELTYPTLGKGKSSSKCHFLGIC